MRFIAHGDITSVKKQGPSPFDMKYLSDGYNRFLDADGYPAIQPPWGTLNAINLSTGEIAWKIPFGEYPDLAAKGVPITGSENYGGPVVTAGGLLFIAATNFDRKFRAFDKATGKTALGKPHFRRRGNATPATYEINGRQFVVIAAGGGKSNAPSGGTIVAFAATGKIAVDQRKSGKLRLSSSFHPPFARSAAGCRLAVRRQEPLAEIPDNKLAGRSGRSPGCPLKLCVHRMSPDKARVHHRVRTSTPVGKLLNTILPTLVFKIASKSLNSRRSSSVP